MDYRSESPPILRDFLVYHETIQGHSPKTVDEYFLDLRSFFRYLKLEKRLVPKDTPMESIPIDDVDIQLIRSVTLTDVYAYMSYLSRDRAAHPNSPDTSYGLSASSRARKVATIRSFYKYLTNKAKLLTENPMQDLDSPRLKKSLPRYLDLEESVELLESVDGANSVRDYCILTLFLNCGPADLRASRPERDRCPGRSAQSPGQGQQRAGPLSQRSLSAGSPGLADRAEHAGTDR